MPKYAKGRGEERPYKRRHKTISNTKHLTHIVAHIPNNVWDTMRKQALKSKGKKHRKKVLPSAFQTLADTKHPTLFNRKLLEEHQKHEDHSLDFHKGGGLTTAVNAVTDQLWNAFSAVPGGEVIHSMVASPS